MAVSSRSRGKVAGTAFALFGFSLLLTAYSARNPWTSSVGASVSSVFLSPLQYISSSAYLGVGGVWQDYVALVGVREENEQLLMRFKALEAQNSKLLELRSENARLKSLLEVSESTGLTGIAARVIGRAPTNWSQSITVDAGVDELVQKGLPVLDGKGVVGQVVAVGPSSARVLLITDPASGVDVLVQGSRAHGVVEGTGDGCSLEYVLAEDEVNIGDRVITSGMDGIYPKGLLVGIVSEVESTKRSGMFKSVAVKPVVEVGKLENVLLIKPRKPGDKPSDLGLPEMTELTGAKGGKRN